jgi:hypothetical protein
VVATASRTKLAVRPSHLATTWRLRGYRIPDDRFRGYVGPDHGLRIQGRPFLVVGGYPRFQYEGYWISAVDPWPEDWGNDWYDTDDVYVNYADNGYYLYNRRYPSAPGNCDQCFVLASLTGAASREAVPS